MNSVTHRSHGNPLWRHTIGDSEVRVAAVAAVCLILESVIAKNVIGAELDFISRFAPFWVFVAYLVTGLRDRASELSFMAAIVVTTAAVLVVFAL